MSKWNGWVAAAMIILVAWASSCQSRQGERTRPLLVAALGDSITWGERPGVSAEHVFPSILQDMLREAGLRGAAVLNSGRPSGRSDTGLARLDRDVLSLSPDFVIVMFGTNDAFIDPGKSGPRLPVADYIGSLDAIIAHCRKAGAVPVLMTPPPLGNRCFAKAHEPYASSRNINFSLEDYVEACRVLARRSGVPLVDLFGDWKDHEHRGADINRWMTDGMHPNPEGHGLIAKSLWRVLAKEIQAIPRPKAVQRADYSIPTLDVSGQEFRQVVVDREAGQYLGHPTTVLLEDHTTMLVVYPKGHGRGAVVMKRSLDAGRTWSERLPTPENWVTSQEVPTLHRTTDPGGIKRLIMFSGLFPIRRAVSEDDGITWSPLEPIGDFGGIVAMGCVERMRNGEYVAMFHDDGRFIAKGGERTGVFTLYKVVSRDGGLTWSAPEVILKGSRVHLCEPGIIRSPNGSRLAVLLRENSRTRNSFVIFSEDEGATWSEPRELPAALTGDRHTGKYAPDGRLFVSFRDRTHLSPTWGDWVAWVGTYADIEEGREGQYRVRLMDNTRGADCAYPGVEVLPDGTFVTTTYGHWIEGEEPFIVSVRLRLEELDRLAQNGRVMAQEKISAVW